MGNNHKKHEKKSNMQQLLAEQIAASVVQHTRSKEFRSELIGEVLTHAGHNLITSAASYMPIQESDLLATPQPVGDNGDAVVLTKTITRAGNSYTAAIRVKFQDGKPQFDYLLYTPNELNTLMTQFIKLPPEHAAELERQLAIVCKAEGMVMLCVSVLVGHFKKPVVEDPAHHPVQVAQKSPEELQAAAAANKAAALAQASEGLPEPDDTLL